MQVDSTNSRTEQIRRALLESGLEPEPPHPCGYLPGQQARSIGFLAGQLPPGLYHSLMDLNFRRSGVFFYRPACERCQQCQAIRVPVDGFRPNRAQRRCWKRNQDLDVQVGPPVPTQDKHRLYRAYLDVRHDKQMGGSWDEFCAFLYESPIDTIEVVYRLAGRVVAVGIVDAEPGALSTVYCYYDSALAARSLGVFNVLWTIEHCRTLHVPHLYLGFYVRDCAKMNYKSNFQPCELLDANGRWQRHAAPRSPGQ